MSVINWDRPNHHQRNTKSTKYNMVYLKKKLNWLGHVERIAEDNNAQKIKRWKPLSKRPTGRPKTRWEDDVLEDIKSINVAIGRK